MAYNQHVQSHKHDWSQFYYPILVAKFLDVTVSCILFEIYMSISHKVHNTDVRSTFSFWYVMWAN